MKLPTTEIKRQLDNSLINGDAEYMYHFNFFPAAEILDRHISKCPQQQIIKNWSTLPGLHRSIDVGLLDSNLFNYERLILKVVDGTHPLLKKKNVEAEALITSYEGQYMADFTCLFNLSFGEN